MEAGAGGVDVEREKARSIWRVEEGFQGCWEHTCTLCVDLREVLAAGGGGALVAGRGRVGADKGVAAGGNRECGVVWRGWVWYVPGDGFVCVWGRVG